MSVFALTLFVLFKYMSSSSLLLFGSVPQMESLHVLNLSESEVSHRCYQSNI